MRHRFPMAAILATCTLVLASRPLWSAGAPDTSGHDMSVPGPDPQNYDWWRKARFGVFIHWGPGAFLHINGFRRQNTLPKSTNASGKPLPPGFMEGSWKKYTRGKVPQDVYDNLYRLFNPTKFNADEWVQFFKSCGAGYIVLTTKHHDGFCLWDSKYTKYDMMSTPFKRDVCKELSDACHKYGLRIIWYYSKWDVYETSYDIDNPAPYYKFLYNQVKELMTKYAPVAGTWWDGGKIKFTKKQLDDLYFMIKKANPGYVSNGRAGRPSKGVIFRTPEQRLGAFEMSRPWETCAVVENSTWIWGGGHNIKSPEVCLNYLVSCAAGDGNLLLNFGPTPEGEIIPRFRDVYKYIGDYLKKYGKTIYDTRGGPYKPGLWGGSTRRGKTIYLHITEHWPSGVLTLPPLPAKVLSCKALTGGNPSFQQTDEYLKIKLAPKSHNSDDTIIELTIDKDAMDIKPIKTVSNAPTYTVNAKVTASSTHYKIKGLPMSNCGLPGSMVPYSIDKDAVQLHFGEEPQPRRNHRYIIQADGCRKLTPEEKKMAEKLTRQRYGEFDRWWRPAPDDKKPWVVVDMEHPVTFQVISISDYFGHVRGFELQYYNHGTWKTFYSGGPMNNFVLRLQKPITTSKVKLIITKMNEGWTAPSITKFDLYTLKKGLQ